MSASRNTNYLIPVYIHAVNTWEKPRSLVDPMMAAFTFVNNCCPGTSYILLARPDTFVNIPELLHNLQQLKARDTSSSDAMARVGDSTSIVREAAAFQKNSVVASLAKQPRFQLPSQKLDGTYIISGKAVPSVIKYLRTLKTRRYNYENNKAKTAAIEIAGVRSIGVSLENIQKRWRDRGRSQGCEILRYMAVWGVSRKDLYSVWSVILSGRCQVRYD